jgi:O-antigen ligase
VSYSYAYVYQGYVDPQNNPAQNFLLQTVLDTGYVGAAIAVALLSVALLLAARRVRGRSRDPLFVATLAGLLFLGLLGVLEASPMIYNTDAFGAFLLLVVSAIVVPAGLAVDSRSRAPVGSARLV